MKGLRCLVRGRVQGVFFRATTQQVAQRLGIHGHVINLPDGSVEVVAYGNATALEELKVFLGRGPEAAIVETLTCEVIAIHDQRVTGFHTG